MERFQVAFRVWMRFSIHCEMLSESALQMDGALQTPAMQYILLSMSILVYRIILWHNYSFSFLSSVRNQEGKRAEQSLPSARFRVPVPQTSLFHAEPPFCCGRRRRQCVQTEAKSSLALFCLQGNIQEVARFVCSAIARCAQIG